MKKSDYSKLVVRLLNDGNYWDAAQLVWPWIQLNEQTARIWNALTQNNMTAVMGHGSASKTFTTAALYMLEWWADPLRTAVPVISATKVSMRSRVWADFSRLFLQARIKMPGILVDSRMVIKAADGDEKHSIQCIAADDPESTSKIQGLHAERTRMMIDEADNPHTNAAWGAIANLSSSGDFKIAALANPEDPTSQFARHCEPINGWDSVDIDTDHEWTSFMGWKTLRLDGLRSPNIVLQRDEFPFLLTNKAMEEIRGQYGEQSVEWYKFVRAWYHKSGTVRTFFTSDIITKMLIPIRFYGATVKIAAMDPAFDGGDNCVLGIGRAGFLANHPSRACAVLDKSFALKRQDLSLDVDIDFGRQAVKILQAEGVKPENFACEASGTSLRMTSYFRSAWSKAFLMVEFHGSPSELKILDEDSKLPIDRFDRRVSELWWAMREWGRAGVLGFSNLDRKLRIDLESRRYDTLNQNKVRAETKKQMKERGLKSPDEADMLAVMVELVRRRLSNLAQTAIPAQDRAPEPTVKRKKGIQRSSFKQTYGVG